MTLGIGNIKYQLEFQEGKVPVTRKNCSTLQFLMFKTRIETIFYKIKYIYISKMYIFQAILIRQIYIDYYVSQTILNTSCILTYSHFTLRKMRHKKLFMFAQLLCMTIDFRSRLSNFRIYLPLFSIFQPPKLTVQSVFYLKHIVYVSQCSMFYHENYVCQILFTNNIIFLYCTMICQSSL